MNSLTVTDTSRSSAPKLSGGMGTSSPCISVGIEAGKVETSFAGAGTASFLCT